MIWADKNLEHKKQNLLKMKWKASESKIMPIGFTVRCYTVNIYRHVIGTLQVKTM